MLLTRIPPNSGSGFGWCSTWQLDIGFDFVVVAAAAPFCVPDFAFDKLYSVLNDVYMHASSKGKMLVCILFDCAVHNDGYVYCCNDCCF